MAEGLGLTFDADGFISKASGIFFAKFGLAPAVRPYVSHGGSIYKLLRLAASWGKERNDRYYKF